jgi:potassium efflux system protein
MCKLSQQAITGLIIIISLASPGVLLSQEQDKPAAEQSEKKDQTQDVGELSLDNLKDKRSGVENAGDLGETVKKNVLHNLDKAIRYREKEIQLAEEANEIAQMVKTAPERIKEIEVELDRSQPEEQSVETLASNMKPEELEQQIRKVEADLTNAKTALNKWDDILKEQKDRPAQLQQNIANAKLRLSEIESELKSESAPKASPLEIETLKAALLAEQDKNQAQIKSFEDQLLNYDALIALVNAERDLASRELIRQDELIKTWREYVQRSRQLEAKKERMDAEQAKDLAVDMPPVMQEALDINIKLGKKLEEITAEESQITNQLETRQAQLKQLEEDFALAHDQVKYPIHTEAIGMALREQRLALPSIQNYRRESVQRQVIMGEIRSAQIDLDRQRRELPDLDLATKKVIESVGKIPESDIENLKVELRQLLKDRRDLLKKLQAGYRRLFKSVQGLEFIEQEIATKAEEEARFLDGHLIWIRSAKTIGLEDLKNLPKALTWLASPYNWWLVLQDLGHSFQRYSALWIFGLLIAGVVIASRRWVKQDLSRVARQVYSVETDSFVLTLRALGLTGLLALGWPMLMGVTAWLLMRLPLADDFTRAISYGLLSAAQILGATALIRQLCRQDGVAAVHFKWGQNSRQNLRRNLLWLMLVAVPLYFIVVTAQIIKEPIYSDSLGRLALIVTMIALSVFVARLLRFSGDIVSRLVRRQPESWLARLRYIWYPLAVGVPLVLALLAAMGYYYSALAVDARLGSTIYLVLGLIMINDLLLRWLYVSRRRLAWEKTKRKQAAKQEQYEKEHAGDTSLKTETVPIEEPEIKISQIDEQNRTLLRTIMLFAALIGLWAIWAQILPALNFMQKVQLWTYQLDVDGVTKTLPITLGHLITGIVVAALTFVSARNIPGVLEITILKRLPMDAGARYALTTISRYTISAVGTIAAFSYIGINWSRLQWLVAALSVGLGFGLQEIVANFVSGLIILFERPYRPGDIVTIGEVSGRVSRIRIRATTIVDWDRRELIVPNKDFITGQLINWSLSDKVTRLIVPVGIAYGSDTVLADKLLRKVAADHPQVLDEPGSSALFLGFGDNSLNFELRAFIDEPLNRVQVISDLHRAIDDAFREANIEISFPQRDVHLDQNGPLEVRVLQEQSNTTQED